MINKRLVHWLESNSILPDNFFGFRPGRSTIDAINQLTTDIHRASIDKEHLIAAFLDIESAYPNVHIPTLAKILSQMELPTHFTQYITRMFINPRVYHINDTGISCRNWYLGLPQGISLSPTLFNIYALHLISDIPHCECLSFADDIVRYSAHKELAIAVFRTQRALS